MPLHIIESIENLNPDQQGTAQEKSNDWFPPSSYSSSHSTTTQTKYSTNMKLVHEAYPTLRQLELQDNDILCTKDKSMRNHPGNCFFHAHIDKLWPTYKQNKSKLERMKFTKMIVDNLKLTHKVRFVKFDEETASWIEVDSMVAREKVGQAIRLAIRCQEKQALKAMKKAQARHPLSFITSMDVSSSESESSDEEMECEEAPEATTSSSPTDSQTQEQDMNTSSSNLIMEGEVLIDFEPSDTSKSSTHSWTSDDFNFLLNQNDLAEGAALSSW